MPKRNGPVPDGLPALLSERTQSRPSIVWLATTPFMNVSACIPGKLAAPLITSVFRDTTAVICRVAVPKVPVAVTMTMPLVSTNFPPPSTARPVRTWSPA